MKRRVSLVVITVAIGCAGTSVAILAQTSDETPIAGQHNVVPHLVPDVGGLQWGSPGATATPKVAAQPDIHLIPSAGGPIDAYGGSPDGATIVPVKH